MGVGLYVGNSVGVGRQLDNGLCQDESRLVNWRKCEKEGESKSSRIDRQTNTRQAKCYTK